MSDAASSNDPPSASPDAPGMGVADVPDLPAALDEASVAEFELQSVPYDGRLYLDVRDSNSFILTDTVTHWAYILGGTGWVLEIEGSKAIVAQAGEDDDFTAEHRVEDLQTTVLLRHPIGHADQRWFLYDPWAPSGTSMQDLEQLRMAHHEATISVSLLGAGDTLDIKSYSFQRPRGAQTSVFISMPDFFDKLAFKCYKSISSQWTYRGWRRWTDILAPQCAAGFVVHSRHMNHSEDVFCAACFRATVACQICHWVCQHSCASCLASAQPRGKAVAWWMLAPETAARIFSTRCFEQ